MDTIQDHIDTIDVALAELYHESALYANEAECDRIDAEIKQLEQRQEHLKRVQRAIPHTINLIKRSPYTKAIQKGLDEFKAK